jgi:hypothetical protein
MDPYKPPQALLVSSDDYIRPSRPSQVTLAIRIMWVLWGAAVLYLVGLYVLVIAAGGADQGSLLPVGAMQLLIICLIALLIRTVSQGRNWARLLYMWLVGLSSALVLIGVSVEFANPQSDLLGTARGIIAAMANGYVIWLLLRPASREWFQIEAKRVKI